MRAIAARFTGLNASLREECSFFALNPPIMLHASSLIDSCMQIKTPESEVFAINDTALMRLIAASLDPRSLLRCEPTITTGIGRCSKMNPNAAAV